MRRSGPSENLSDLQFKNTPPSSSFSTSISFIQWLRRVGRTALLTLAWLLRIFFIVSSVVFLAGHAYLPLIIALLLLAITFALLRTRLISFPFFLNRSLSYSLLTLALAVVYFVGIATYEYIHHALDPIHSGNEIAGALSALAVVALFQPLRQQLQGFIDRRFYRHRYNAEEAILTFSASVREEINLDQINTLLLATVRQNLLPSTSTLWLCEPASSPSDPSSSLDFFIWQAPPKNSSTTGLLSAQHDQALARPVLTLPTNDPFLKALLTQTTLVEIHPFLRTSSLAQSLHQSGMAYTLALINRSSLVGLLSLGSRLSGQAYEPYDQYLLTSLAAQAAPALRIAQMVREQHALLLEHEKIEQELQMAQRIQQTFLPKELPQLLHCRLSTYYQPAHEVGGDFYDFLSLPDGRLGLVIGDVAGKGIPAALFMTTTCTMLRSVSKELSQPGAVLAHVNDLLCANIPSGMFVTCFYAIFNPLNGELQYANAGHDLPFHLHLGQAREICATGMPLGCFPSMFYEDCILSIPPGSTLLFYSDGLVEAHDHAQTMFGFPHLQQLLSQDLSPSSLIDYLLQHLHSFTGEAWEQEDDVTLVTLHVLAQEQEQPAMPTLLSQWSLPSIVGNERLAMQQVTDLALPLGLDEPSLARLQTAVSEAVMNAMEHGNLYQSEKLVTLQFLDSPSAIFIRISDESKDELVLPSTTPDLDAKLSGSQSARGWGLFLIKNLVDELHIHSSPPAYLELVLYKPS